MQTMNLAFCELFSLHGLAVKEAKSRGLNRGASLRGADIFGVNDAALGDRITDFVLSCLRGGTQSQLYPMGQVLTSSAYTALLPTLWSLINNPITVPKPVLEALLSHGVRTPSTSAVKGDSVTFIGKLLLVGNL